VSTRGRFGKWLISLDNANFVRLALRFAKGQAASNRTGLRRNCVALLDTDTGSPVVR
jgi:hypothetical protein